MEIIVTAKDRQAAEANKNASILLDQIEKEQTEKAAAARKKDKKKKQRRKEKSDAKSQKEKEPRKDSSPELESDGRGENVEEERPEEIRKSKKTYDMVASKYFIYFYS